MRRSFTAAVARNETITDGFETEPYECGWASEARWFVRALSWSGSGLIRLSTQLSPDGLFWCDADAHPIEIRGTELSTANIQHFGNWLRLKAEVVDEPECSAIIYLVLKE